MFEKMVLEGFQAGLSWLTILEARELPPRFPRLRSRTHPRWEKDIARLMADAGIVRNRLKIEATIANATAYLVLEREGGLARFLWRFGRAAPSPTCAQISRIFRRRRKPRSRSRKR